MSRRKRPLRWLSKKTILAVHHALLRDHGGATGIRDEGLLDSALARPQQLAHYERGSTVFRLAAAYAFGLASNHPFVDGNKRVALTAAAVFLEINGFELVAPEPMAVVAFTDLAAGELTEDELAHWLKDNCSKIED
jgi:death-on-curing protein